MSDDAIHFDRLLDLLGTVCDGSASQDDLLDLDSILSADREAVRDYFDYCRLQSALRLELRADRATRAICAEIGIDSVVVGTCANDPATTDLPDSFVPNINTGHFSRATGYLVGWPVAYLAATVIFGIGLLIGTIAHVSQPVQTVIQSLPGTKHHLSPALTVKSVGQITGMVDCRWADPATEAFDGEHVPLGRKYALASGLMEITYGTGAKVILQGPMTYEAESANGGYLFLGKLTGKVGTVQAKGFVVRTPTAIVTDLGTEFGVEVSKEGHTTSHVYRGSVRLQVIPSDGKADGIAKVLHENETARVRIGGNESPAVLDRLAAPVDFVREIPRAPTLKTLDLADVVAGGDGFSGRRNRGIDSTNGRIATAVFPQTSGFAKGDGRYHRVDEMAFVDGVFIPDGRSGPVQIDSASHTFSDFITGSNLCGRRIWAAGMFPKGDPALTHGIRTLLGNIDYARPEHGCLLLVANNGITFDLQAIRRANPGYRLLQFRSMAGNSDPDSMTTNVWRFADLWVFVDGQIRFRRREINGYGGAFPISVPVGENDRFLTLVSTDGGNGIEGDDILMGDPRLELLPLK